MCVRALPPSCQPRTAEVGGTRTDLDKRVEGLESKTQIKKSAFNAFHELSNLRGESIWKAGFVSNFLRGKYIKKYPFLDSKLYLRII